VNAVLPDPDESIERALFERRARVLTAAAVVPSLDAVLRAARSEPRETHEVVAAVPAETSGARRRAWGLALAAACLLTVMKAHPREATRPGIVADVRAEAPLAAGPGVSLCEAQEASECAPETTCAASPTPPAPVVHDDGVCSSTPTTFASSATLSCDPDDAVRSESH
jgi:hypothetical protein